MKRNQEPLIVSPHWHVDCRILADLPEDNIVGTRFLINVIFTAAALVMVLYTGWLGYVNLNLRHQIRDWENRINDNRAEVGDIKRMQRDYATEAAKIDQAYALVKPQLYVSGLLTNIARMRPEQVVIDIVEWNDSGVVLRGSLAAENSERATRLLGGFVEQLRRDGKISSVFREIGLTDMDRSGGDTLRFEIILRLKSTRT
jgi:hypothetical protein